MANVQGAERPSITIIVTCFNDGRYLHESVGSAVDLVAAEPSCDFRISIADDGSTEMRTVEVLARLEREGFQVMRLPHRGLAATRNAALRSISSSWFIPLDPDNRLRPTIVSRLLPALISKPTAAMAYGDAMRFGQRTGRWVMGAPDVELLQRQNHIDNCAVISRAAWDRVGGYDETPTVSEDWDLWKRFLAADLSLEYVPEIVFDYRERSNSLYRQRNKVASSGHAWQAAPMPSSSSV